MKYRKKPVVIEAMEWDGTTPSANNICEKLNARESFRWNFDNQFVIKTLEGEHLVSNGDYIIKGVKGEFYPCKPDIFEMTYEKVEE